MRPRRCFGGPALWAPLAGISSKARCSPRMFIAAAPVRPIGQRWCSLRRAVRAHPDRPRPDPARIGSQGGFSSFSVGFNGRIYMVALYTRRPPRPRCASVPATRSPSCARQAPSPGPPPSRLAAVVRPARARSSSPSRKACNKPATMIDWIKTAHGLARDPGPQPSGPEPSGGTSACRGVVFSPRRRFTPESRRSSDSTAIPGSRC